MKRLRIFEENLRNNTYKNGLSRTTKSAESHGSTHQLDLPFLTGEQFWISWKKLLELRESMSLLTY